VSAAADFALVLLASAAIVVWLKERSLYVLFLVTYTQNFVLAYLYTAGWAGRDYCRSMLLLKEFILLGLFGYSVVYLHRRFHGRWPRPLLILLFFAGYCILRFGWGAVFLNDASLDGLRKLRMMIYPVQILTVAMAVRWSSPEFTRRFVRDMTYCLGILAAVAVLMFLFARVDFWKQNADIASYNVDVKGDDPSSVVEEQGVPGTGLGREAFLFLSSFRAMGTFADPLTLGFAMIVPILLLKLCYPSSEWNYFLLGISAAALFFTFSRSSWMFLALAFSYVWFRKGNYRILIGLGLVSAIALVTWPPLAEFAASDLLPCPGITRRRSRRGDHVLLSKGVFGSRQTWPAKAWMTVSKKFPRTGMPSCWNTSVSSPMPRLSGFASPFSFI